MLATQWQSAFVEDILPFRCLVDLRFDEGTERYDLAPLCPRIRHQPLDQHSADAAPAKRFGHTCVIGYQPVLAGTRISQLCFMSVEHKPVAAFGFGLIAVDVGC